MKSVLVIRLLFLAVLAFFISTSCKKQLKEVTSPQAMVVCAHPLAAEVGITILKKGGNAVDASIATQFALAVVFPMAGNIGGGGFMLMRSHSGQYDFIDYRETAPSGSTTDLFVNQDGSVDTMASREGHRASGVPGSVAGMEEAHKKYGKLPWKELVQPAIDLAQYGFALTEQEAEKLNLVKQKLKKNCTVQPTHLLNNWKKGDSIRHIDLANTLSRIRDYGAAGFYTGRTADLLIEEMQRGKGLITHSDLKDYKPVWRTPILARYKNYTIATAPPPSSGGIALLQMLKTVENYPIKKWGALSVPTTHLTIEVERRAFADRAFYLGDPAFVHVPVKQLLDSTYLVQRMASFNPQQATPSVSIKEGQFPMESEQTTHLCVVDADRNAVSCTTTINGWYGSGVVVGGAGFFLNNEMDDFSAKPGVPNMFGAIGGDANKIEPGKRMLSSMTPTIIEKDKKLFMVVGTPGGTTIITQVFQVILNMIEHGMTAQEAVAKPRIHSQWLPDVVFTEPRVLLRKDSLKLVKMGHTFKQRDPFGRAEVIYVDGKNILHGGADPRGNDKAIGY